MKGNTLAIWIIIALLAVSVFGGGYFLITGNTGASQSGVAQNVQQIAQASKAGEVSSIKVAVRDLSNNNINTKLAVATYCQDGDGSFLIDGTTSSTSTEITGQTTQGKTVTCWAFDSTHQTVNPVTVVVDEEVEHVLIDAYTLPTNGHLQFYTDTLATGTGGVINISVGADSTATFNKLRYTNNNTNTIFPLGGFYIDTVTSSNISDLTVNGGGALSLRGSSFLPATSSMSVAKSALSSSVSTRKDIFDYVFEVDSGVAIEGNDGASPVLLEENDYVESGSVRVTGGGNGCVAELVSSYAFTKGFYRGTLSDTIGYGHENDASTSSVISADITGDTFYCTA